MSEHKLENDINIITEILLQNNSKIEAIILYGSYGRGEGAFYEEDGESHTYNDYDLLIVVNKHLNNINELKEKLKNNLSIKWIDLSQTTSHGLKSFKPSIYSYDLKYGSKVIWGDKNILENIPIQSPSQITAKDIEILYFTRLYPFIGSLGQTGFSKKLAGENSRFFRYQMAKAIFAVIDSLLIRSGQYHSSYRERLKRVEKDNDNLKELGNWALSEKLTPQDIEMNTEEIRSLYTSVLKLYLEKMFEGLSCYYNKRITSTDDIRNAINFSYKTFVLKLKSIIRKKSYEKYNRGINLNLAQSYLAEAFLKEGGSQEEMLKKASKMINKIEPGLTLVENDWNDLCYKVAKLRVD